MMANAATNSRIPIFIGNLLFRSERENDPGSSRRPSYHGILHTASCDHPDPQRPAAISPGVQTTATTLPQKKTAGFGVWRVRSMRLPILLRPLLLPLRLCSRNRRIKVPRSGEKMGRTQDSQQPLQTGGNFGLGATTCASVRHPKLVSHSPGIRWELGHAAGQSGGALSVRPRSQKGMTSRYAECPVMYGSFDASFTKGINFWESQPQVVGMDVHLQPPCKLLLQR